MKTTNENRISCLIYTFMTIGVCSMFGLELVTTVCVVIGTIVAWSYMQMMKKEPSPKSAIDYLIGFAISFIFFYFVALGVCAFFSAIFLFLKKISQGILY